MPAPATAGVSPPTAAAPAAGRATAPPVHPGKVLEASPAPTARVTPAQPASSAAALAAAVLASRKADPAIGGRLARPRRPHKPAMAAAPSPCPSIIPAASMEGGSVTLLPVPESVPVAKSPNPVWVGVRCMCGCAAT